MATKELTLVPPGRLGALLSTRRRERGLDVVDMAQLSGGNYNPSTIEALERGRLHINDGDIEQLVDLYELDAGPVVPDRSQLIIDLDTGIIGVGDTKLDVGKTKPGAQTVDQVLERYLSLLYMLRNLEPGTQIPLRDRDLDVLGSALDLRLVTLERQLGELMVGGDVDKRTKSLKRRLIVPGAGLLVALTAVGSLVIVNGGDAGQIATPVTDSSPAAALVTEASAPAATLASQSRPIVVSGTTTAPAAAPQLAFSAVAPEVADTGSADAATTAPAVEAPAVEEAPVVEAPVVEAEPAVEAPAAEAAPAVEAPAVEAQAAAVEAAPVTPAADAPVADAEVAETPAVEAEVAATADAAPVTPAAEAPAVDPAPEVPAVAAPPVEVAPELAASAVVEAPPVVAPPAEAVAEVVATPADAHAALGAEAEALIAYPFRAMLPGWTINYAGSDAGYQGITNLPTQTITIYIDPGSSAQYVAEILAHEVGHALDVLYLDDAGRTSWLNARGMAFVWWPGDGLNDFAVGAGDFAEAVSALWTGSPSDSVHGPFSAEQLALVADLLP